MSTEVFLRGFFSAIYSLGLSWLVFSRYDEEIGTEEIVSGQPRYQPYAPSVLPFFIPLLFVLACISDMPDMGIKMILSACFSIFLQICLYYLLLMLVLPFLRRIISARVCAMLWLLPNYLYILFYGHMELPSPLIVITASGKSAQFIFGIWIIGFAAVMLWKVVEHLVFRRRVLRWAKLVTDPDVIAVWNALIDNANFKKPKFKLVSSPAVSTPLTIGLFKRSTRVVLPEKKYSRENLELILHHEIVHIGREDAWSKFFMVFCTAMCWFNPLMWVAMRKSADDMELSCDETVLLEASEATRKQYAILLLDTAGDERGFTTCLSASANAMRYRLKSITKPVKRRSGALIVGAVFYLLCMTSGYVSLAYDGNSGAQMVYQCDDFSDYTIRHVSMYDDEFNTTYEKVDEAAFHEYLSGLTVYELTGNYSFSDSQRYYHYLMETPTGTQVFTLYDNVVKLFRLSDPDRASEYYYIPEGINWEYIDSIIVPQPALNVHLYEQQDAYGNDLSTYVNYLWKTVDGERILIHEGDYPNGEYHGTFGHEPYPYQATFTFSQELAAPFTVLVESWDYSKSYTVTQSEMTDGFTMDLPPYPAHYTIYASFHGADGALYEAEFWFNIGAIDSE